MKKFILPYDSKTVTLKLNDNNFAGLLESKQSTYNCKESENDIVEKSLDCNNKQRSYKTGSF